MTSSRKTVSHTGIYTLSIILRNSVGIIMLPIYTRYLTPEDYGIIELLTMSIDFAGIILGNRIGDAVFRFYMTENNATEKRSIISTAFILAIGINLVGFSVLALASEKISLYIFGLIAFKHIVILFSITLITEAFIQLPLHYIRAAQKPWLYFFINTAKLILQVCLNIYFVVILEMRVEGVVYSAIITTSLLSIFLAWFLIKSVGLQFSMPICKKIFVFSWPIGIATLASFFITFGDRYFIRVFQGLEEVGVYTLAYKFGFVFGMLAWEPFSKAWDSHKYEILKENAPNRTYQRVFSLLSFCMIILALCIALFVEDLLKIMSNPGYWEAAAIVPIILLAYLFHAWSQFCNFGILLSKKTKYIAYFEWLSAAAIAALYLTLIPHYGMYGAAIATLGAFTLRFILIYHYAKNLYDMNIQWKQPLLVLSLGCMVYLASQQLPEDIIYSISLKMVLLMGFFAVIYCSNLTSSAQKAAIHRFIKQNILRRFSRKV